MIINFSPVLFKQRRSWLVHHICGLKEYLNLIQMALESNKMFSYTETYPLVTASTWNCKYLRMMMKKWTNRDISHTQPSFISLTSYTFARSSISLTFFSSPHPHFRLFSFVVPHGKLWTSILYWIFSHSSCCLFFILFLFIHIYQFISHATLLISSINLDVCITCGYKSLMSMLWHFERWWGWQKRRWTVVCLCLG